MQAQTRTDHAVSIYISKSKLKSKPGINTDAGAEADTDTEAQAEAETEKVHKLYSDSLHAYDAVLRMNRMQVQVDFPNTQKLRIYTRYYYGTYLLGLPIGQKEKAKEVFRQVLKELGELGLGKASTTTEDSAEELGSLDARALAKLTKNRMELLKKE